MGSGKRDDCVASVAKCLLFSFNFVFWLTGITFMVIGVWAYMEKHAFDHKGTLREDFNLYNAAFDVSILTVCLGSAIFIISFSGCVGALRENVCLLKFFSYSMAVIVFAQLVLAVLAFVFSQEVQNRVTTVLETQVILRYRTDLDLENLVDWLQLTFSCCGFGELGYKDWSLNIYFNCSVANPSYERCAVPYSCCLTPLYVSSNLTSVNSMCGFNVQSMEYENASHHVYTHGCIETVLNRARSNLYTIGGVATGLSIPQLLGVVLARILADKIEGQAGRTIAYL